MADYLEQLRGREPFFWRNPDYGRGENSAAFTLDDMLDAEARLARFAPLLAQLFDEAAEQFGIIESRLLDVPKLAGRNDTAQGRSRSAGGWFGQGARRHLQCAVFRGSSLPETRA